MNHLPKVYLNIDPLYNHWLNHVKNLVIFLREITDFIPLMVSSIYFTSYFHMSHEESHSPISFECSRNNVLLNINDYFLVLLTTESANNHVGVSVNGCTPTWMVYNIMEIPIKIDDLGVPL